MQGSICEYAGRSEPTTRHAFAKASISLDCDCFATAGDKHREWVAK